MQIPHSIPSALELGASARTAVDVAVGDVFRRILVPVDFSEGARAALTVALSLRQRLGSRIDVFHMTAADAIERAGGPVAADDILAEVTGELCRFVESVTGGRSGDVNAHVLPGVDVVRSLVNAAQRFGATAIILSSRHRQSVFRTNPEKIARRFSGAVVVVPAPG